MEGGVQGGRRSYQGGQWSTLAVRMGLQLFKNKGLKEVFRDYSRYEGVFF